MGQVSPWWIRYIFLLHRCRRAIEFLQGLDFTAMVDAAELGLDPARSYRSSPSGGSYLASVFRSLEITTDDAIIDVGCGKGSAMRTMLQFPFKRVDGIEIAERLARIGQKNFRKLQADRATIFNCDATTFTEYEAYSYVYFYNPFPAEVMVKVIRRLNIAMQKTGKNITIIYNNPVCAGLVTRHGFVLKGRHLSEWGTDIHIYRPE